MSLELTGFTRKTLKSFRQECFKQSCRRPISGRPLELVQWLEDRRHAVTMTGEKIDLAEVFRDRGGPDAVFDESLCDELVCVRTVFQDREVRSWCQPLMFDSREQLCGLLLRRSSVGIECLVQAVEEPCIIGGCQLGPTLQTDVSRCSRSSAPPPYLAFFLKTGGRRVLFDVIQSEEGGRFFHDKKRYMALFMDKAPEPADEWYRWTCVEDLKRAIVIPNTVNIFARTLLTLLL